jgi:hypothetical protein
MCIGNLDFYFRSFFDLMLFFGPLVGQEEALLVLAFLTA